MRGHVRHLVEAALLGSGGERWIMEYKWNDGLLPGGRTPRLYLARGGEAVKFLGENIPGICEIAAAIYDKNVKWSCTRTRFTLLLAPGVRALKMVSPLHGVWGEGLGSWADAAKELSLPLERAQAIVRAEYAQT